MRTYYEGESAFHAANTMMAGLGLSQDEITQLRKMGRGGPEDRNPRFENMLRDGIREKLLQHPSFKLVKECAKNHPDDEERMLLRSVEDVICEQAMWAVELTLEEGKFSTDFSVQALIARWLLGAALIRAVPYVWTNKIYDVVATTPLPRHKIQTQLPFPELWFTFQNGYPTQDNTDTADGMVAMEIPPVPDVKSGEVIPQRIRVALLGSNDNTHRPFCCPIDLRHGDIYPDNFLQDPNGKEMVTQFLNCLSFINSPYIVIDQKGLCRQARRRLGMDQDEQNQKVHFVILRAPLIKRDYESSESDVDWKYRWLVRGHHRAQWCPSTQSHKLMWIAPYIKGPEDKPLKARAYKVVR